MIETRFASAERSSEIDVWAQHRKFASFPVLNNFLAKIDQYILVLNANRQIIYCNQSFLNDYNIASLDDLLGKRVGEALDCRYAWHICGCGTSDFCKDCGAAKAMLKSQAEKSDVYRECIILTKNSKTIELAVTCKHIEIEGENFSIFSLADISKAKQYKALEEVFYHDISNIAGGIHSMIQLMYDDRITDKAKVQEQLTRCSSELVDELHSHRILKAAERKELSVKLSNLNSLECINRSVKFVERTMAARGKIIYIHHTSLDFDFLSDPNLLNRVLVNLLTNALEATDFSQKVTIGCGIIADERVFWVHNISYIQPEIQSKIFRQAFSTKKRGSGFGIQSIRIITEGYLEGRVDFESIKTEGTTFKIYLPIS